MWYGTCEPLARWRLPCMGNRRAVGWASPGPASRAGPSFSPGASFARPSPRKRPALNRAEDPRTPLPQVPERGFQQSAESRASWVGPGRGVACYIATGGGAERAQPHSCWNPFHPPLNRLELSRPPCARSPGIATARRTLHGLCR